MEAHPFPSRKYRKPLSVARDLKVEHQYSCGTVCTRDFGVDLLDMEVFGHIWVKDWPGY
jgi:hypothetical protein